MKKKIIWALAVVLAVSVIANIAVIGAAAQTERKRPPEIFFERSGAKKSRTLRIGQETPLKLSYLQTYYASLDQYFDEYTAGDGRKYRYDRNGNFTGYSIEKTLDGEIKNPVTLEQATEIADVEMQRLFGDEANRFEEATLLTEREDRYCLIYVTRYGFVTEKCVGIDVRKDGIIRSASFPNFYDFEAFDPALLNGVERQTLDALFRSTAEAVYGDAYISAQVNRYELKKTENGYEIELSGEVHFGEVELIAALEYRYALG